MTAKRYMLFAGEHYYPGGGANDLIDSFELLDVAQNRASEEDCDWWHIYDIISDRIIEFGRGRGRR